MSKRKLAVLVFSSKGILAVEPTVRGFLTTSLKFVRLQAKLQKKFRAKNTPIAIGIQTPYFDTIRWELLEWVVPWQADAAPQDEHDHLKYLKDDTYDC